MWDSRDMRRHIAFLPHNKGYIILFGDHVHETTSTYQKYYPKLNTALCVFPTQGGAYVIQLINFYFTLEEWVDVGDTSCAI